MKNSLLGGGFSTNQRLGPSRSYIAALTGNGKQRDDIAGPMGLFPSATLNNHIKQSAMKKRKNFLEINKDVKININQKKIDRFKRMMKRDGFIWEIMD